MTKQHHETSDIDLEHPFERGDSGSPGKRSMTQGLSPRPIIFRVESAEAARELGAAFGPRDRNGVADGAETAVDRAAGGSGEPLREDLRARFESSLGTDLSAVRLHTGGASAEASAAVGAKAYTVGNDVHFGAGQYQPDDPFGMHLIAHEVAHTQQQSGGPAHRQHKLEVSTPGDSAEVEADRAADAMVKGESASVSGSGGLSRKVFRDEVTEPVVQVTSPVVGVEEESLVVSIQNDGAAKQVASEMSWGMEQTVKADGRLNPNTEVAAHSADNNGLIELSQEVSIAKPLHLAWIQSAAAVNTIRARTGIDPNTPGVYKKTLDKLGAEMEQSTDLSTNKLRPEVKDVSVNQVGAAADHIKGALTRVNIAKNKLQVYKQQLEAALTRKELESEKEKLAAIKEEIKNVAAAIQSLASLALKFSTAQATSIAAVGAVTQEMRDKKMNLKSKAQPNGALEKANSGAEHAGTGLEVLGKLTASEPLEKVLEWTLYDADLKQANSKINALGANIAGIDAGIQRLETAGLLAEINASQTDFSEAKKKAAHTSREFFKSMRAVGRAWDQRNMSDKEKRDPNNSGAVPDTEDAFSAEAILSCYAALQVRGEARGVFAAQAVGNPTLEGAQATLAKSLKSNMMHVDDDGRVKATPDLDSREFHREDPNPGLFNEVRAIRTTVANLDQARKHVTEKGKAEAALEAEWQSVVASGSRGQLG